LYFYFKHESFGIYEATVNYLGNNGTDPMTATVVGSGEYTIQTGVAVTPFTPIAIQNAIGTVTYSVSPALPLGLKLNTATGEITGTPI
jgi:hypothetical protein